MSQFLVTSAPADLGDDQINFESSDHEIIRAECLRRLKLGDKDIKVWTLYLTAEIGVVLTEPGAAK